MAKTIAVFGTGSVNKRAAVAQVKDFVGDDELTLVIALTDTQFTESTKAVAQWAVDNDASLTVVTEQGEDVPDDAEDFLDAADTRVSVAKVPNKVVNLVSEAGGTLLLAFHEEDDDTNAAMDLAVAKGLRPLDLTDGLQPLFFADEEQPEEVAPAPAPEPEPVVETPAPRARRSRAKAAVEEVPVPAPVAPAETPDEAQQVIAPDVPSAASVGLVEDAEVGRAVKVLLLALAEAQKAVAEPKRGPGRPRKNA